MQTGITEITFMSVPRVYFYCCDEPTNLQDDIIQIAEGLEELGIPFYANANYWLKSTQQGDYLFKATPDVAPDDCDIVVLPFSWFNWVRIGKPAIRRPFPPDLFKPHSKYLTVYMDNNDGYRTVAFEKEFRKFDFIFRTNYNSRFFNPKNFVPWNHGMSRRIIRATSDSLPFSERSCTILFNFGASHPFEHQVRRLASELFRPAIADVLKLDESRCDLNVAPKGPYDSLMWEQTTRRHSPEYYARLKHSAAVACFCGQLVPCFPRDPTWYTWDGGRARVINTINRVISCLIGHDQRIVQWDSWRFWETLAAGCAAFNVDLERFGAVIPEMPRNWRHYIGVDFGNVRTVVERLRDEPKILEQVAT
ncbi:MAG TPA: hypothetical protein VGC95_13095, partial [Chitinophagaceae bacterium]